MPSGWVLLFVAIGASVAWLIIQRLRILENRVRAVPTHVDLEKLGVGALSRTVDSQRQELEGLQGALMDLQREQRDTQEAMQNGRDEVRELRRQLGRLRDEVERMQSQIETVSSKLGEWSAWPQDANSAGGGLRTRITRALTVEGFVDLRILGDLPVGDTESSVVVEARRAGAAYKGTVRVANGDVDELHLTPCYKVFP